MCCCQEDTATLVTVHRHHYGGDQQRRLRGRHSRGHRHPLSGGTATPRVVPTWTWPRRARARVVIASDGVHRPRCDGAPSGAPPLTVCTASHMMVHHWCVSGATTVFHPRARKAVLGTAVVTAVGRAVHHHFYPDKGISRAGARWSSPP